MRRRGVGWGAGSWLLLAPFLLGSLLLVAGPALVSAVFALTSYDALSPPVFVGLETFERLLAYSEMPRAVRATVLFLALAVPLRLLGALLLALLLHTAHRGAVAGRVASYLPTVLPDAVTTLVALWVVNPLYGPLAVAVRAFDGVPGPVLLDPWGSRLTIVAIAVLGLGEGFLVLLAARQELPEALEEMAVLEGAGPLARLRRVTLPWLVPVLGLLSARDLVTSMQAVVVPVLLLTRGGPLGATKLLPVLAYERGFRELKLGEAAAVGVLLTVATGLLVLLQLRLLRRWTRGRAVL